MGLGNLWGRVIGKAQPDPDKTDKKIDRSYSAKLKRADKKVESAQQDLDKTLAKLRREARKLKKQQGN